MGFAPGSPGRVTRRNSATRDGNAWLRQPEDCRGTAEAEAELLSGEPSLQQLVVHTESGAAPCMGIPSALRKQAQRHRRLDGTDTRAHEHTERARLATMAGLPITDGQAGPLTFRDQEILVPRDQLRE